MNYHIWNKIEACIYNSNKSYGVRKDGVVDIKVGTSKTNSFDFLTHKTTVRDVKPNIKEFRFYVDDTIIKYAFYNTKTKEFIKSADINEVVLSELVKKDMIDNGDY